jgi:tripartite-type tricarboxylate transporter receptor subunit TctC
MPNSVKAALIVSLLLSVLISFPASAQNFPTKPIKLVVPSQAGGGHDLTFRAVTSVAADYLGQPIVIQIEPGGLGAIGSDQVSKAKPDGYTLLAGGAGWSSAGPAIEGRSKGPDDLDAVCRINYTSLMLLTHPNAQWKTFKDLMAWVKANPGKLVVGVGTRYIQDDFFWRKLMKDHGISVKIVPFQGGNAQLVALLGGHTEMGGASPVQFTPYKGTGKVIPLLWLDTQRNPMIPDVPTSTEAGYPIVSRNWRGVLAPKGTPAVVVGRLAAAFQKMTENDSVKSMIKTYGEEIQFMGPEEFSKIWREEYEDLKKNDDMFKRKEN